MDLARAPRRARSNARKKCSGYENGRGVDKENGCVDIRVTEWHGKSEIFKTMEYFDH